MLRMSEQVKEFLTEKFNIGAKSGQKADPGQVSKAMRYLRNKDGALLFSPDEWKSAKQVASFFKQTISAAKEGYTGECRRS